MQFTASVHAYDVMSMVRVSWSLSSWSTDEDGKPEASRLLKGYLDYPGIGEQDPTLWLRDALVAALEQL